MNKEQDSEAPLPFTKEPGFDYIVTPEDRERFAPKLATDELYFSGSQVWRFAANNETFGDSCIYRRHKTKEANPVSFGKATEDHYIKRIHKAVHHMEIVELQHELTQLRATIDDHVAKALITNHIIKLSAEEVTRLHAIIDAQAGESESLKLQNAGLHAEFMKMAQQIAVLGGDKASLQSTIDAQKKVIAEAEKAINEARLWMTNPIFTRALTAIRKLEDGK